MNLFFWKYCVTPERWRGTTLYNNACQFSCIPSVLFIVSRAVDDDRLKNWVSTSVMDTKCKQILVRSKYMGTMFSNIYTYIFSFLILWVCNSWISGTVDLFISAFWTETSQKWRFRYYGNVHEIGHWEFILGLRIYIRIIIYHSYVNLSTICINCGQISHKFCPSPR